MIHTSKDFWESETVLVAGQTGFKGAWLSFYLSEMGAEVHCLALDPVSEIRIPSELRLLASLASDSRIDIRDFTKAHEAIRQFRPDVVVHLAAQAIVGESCRPPIDTLSTNGMGTANLLEPTRQLGKGTAFLSVATDKVSANNGDGQTFAEHDALGGNNPHSVRKAAADIVSQMFAKAYLSEIGVAVGIARSGRVIEDGDWSEDRLLPDLARAWSSNPQLRLRFPYFSQPWRHILESLRRYLPFAENLAVNPEMSGPINLGPIAGDFLPVSEVVDIAVRSWLKISSWVEETEKEFGEVKDLSIDSSR